MPKEVSAHQSVRPSSEGRGRQEIEPLLLYELVCIRIIYRIICRSHCPGLLNVEVKSICHIFQGDMLRKQLDWWTLVSEDQFVGLLTVGLTRLYCIHEDLIP